MDPDRAMSEPTWTEGVSLAPMTSWKIGGPARALADPATPEDLTALRLRAEARRWPVLLIGGGSNILVSDQGYPGLVIRYMDRTHDMEAATHREEAIFRAGARMPLTRLARMTAAAGWAGLEWAEGIPGTTAGAIVGNAGAYGGEIRDVLLDIDVVLPDGIRETWPAAALDHSYRHSNLKGRDPTGPAIVSARLRLRAADPVRLAADLKRIAGERKAKTPAGATCGSVFRNPPAGIGAGQLIDLAGCKGLRRGAAVVSRIHANYIVNEGGARARDVLELIDEVRARVRSDAHVDLELEIQLVGFGEFRN
jgi:UDP-N-acetylmuramate dehydrogenase